MRALFVRGGALGDLIVSLPILSALLRSGWEVDVAVKPRFVSLLPPQVGRRLDVGGADLLWLYAGNPAPPGLGPWDVGVAFSAIVGDGLRRAGVGEVFVAPPLVSGARASTQWGAAFGAWARQAGLTIAETGDPRIEASVLRHARGAGAVGAEEGDSGTRPGAARAGADTSDRQKCSIEAHHSRAPVLIGPGAGSAGKRWSIARWGEVAAAITARGAGPVWWVRGPEEVDEPGWPQEDVLSPGLLETAALAATALIWLGPDSGPAHVAAAVGAEVGVVFGPSDASVWAPPGAVVFDWETAPAVVAEHVATLRRRSGGSRA